MRSGLAALTGVRVCPNEGFGFPQRGVWVSPTEREGRGLWDRWDEWDGVIREESPLDGKVSRLKNKTSRLDGKTSRLEKETSRLKRVSFPIEFRAISGFALA